MLKSRIKVLCLFVISLALLLNFVSCDRSKWCSHKNSDVIITYESGSVRPNITVICKKCDTVFFDDKLETGLPIVIIETENANPVTSKENYVNAKMTIINTDDSIDEYTMEIKTRGNATLGYPKIPYKIKLAEKAKVIGMKKNKSWALLANYTDKTLLRTAIGFKTSSLLKMDYTVDSRFVEVIFNGEYIGNYQLAESVKEGSNRVDISDNGFLIERVREVDEPASFTSQSGYLFQFKYPDSDEITNDQINVIKAVMDEFETVLYSEDSKAFSEEGGYRNYIDVESWAKWLIIQNVLENLDTNWYYYKNDIDDDSKICMGPVWDFEWSLGIGWYAGARPNPNHSFIAHHYFARLMQDKYFMGVVKSIWEEYKSVIYDGVLQYIDETSAELNDSQKLNFYKWDILFGKVSVGGIPLYSYENEVACDRQYFINHFEWLDKKITSWDTL